MIFTYSEPWLDEWQTGGTLTYDRTNGVITILAWEPNKMPPTFYDALSGQKRKLNINQKHHTPTTSQPWCAGAKYGHEWDNADDETCKCNRCGASVLFVRALRNIDKPKH